MISLDTNIIIQQGVTEFATVNEKVFRESRESRVVGWLESD